MRRQILHAARAVLCSGLAVLGVIPVAAAQEAVPEEVLAIVKEREQLEQTTWAEETEAQTREQTIVKYWDQLNARNARERLDEKYGVFASFPFETLTISTEGESDELDWGITRTLFNGPAKTLTHDEYRAALEAFQAQGYKIEQHEWHQSKFDYNGGEDARSVFSMTLYIINEDRTERWLINGDLVITWSQEKDEDGLYLPAALEFTNFDLKHREAPQTFEAVATLPDMAGERHVLSYDLNSDGLPELIVPVRNVVLWNEGAGTFRQEPLWGPAVQRPLVASSGIIADFTGNGNPDLICTVKDTPDPETYPVLKLYRGDNEGRFNTEGIRVHQAPLPMQYPSALTAGDIDGDGDLDLWVAQYRVPYEEGLVPTPFYDANDGYPAFLFRNDGNGQWTDITEAAGLAPKRFRRTYAASLIDLNDDGSLDLLNVNDYAGIDVYYNDGTGRFTDVTASVVDETANFGMSHTFADFNQDGILDFYVTGMSSTTARRLEYMNLGRADYDKHTDMRKKMGYGNRMYLSVPGGAYLQPEWKDKVARTGWTWGCQAFDFDNDGDVDIYAANGHFTGNSTKDYCTKFWCHDIYMETPEQTTDTEVTSTFFTKFVKEPLFTGMSWDGWQHNKLLMRQGDEPFVEVGFLMDVDFVYDSRALIATDFDADGRVDIAVTESHQGGSSTLHVYLNKLETDHNWVGVRLREAAGQPSPIGAKITVRSAGGTQVARIVTGDSFRAQQPFIKHFGLGEADAVEEITVQWPNGRIDRLRNPDINVYHAVEPGRTVASAE